MFLLLLFLSRRVVTFQLLKRLVFFCDSQSEPCVEVTARPAAAALYRGGTGGGGGSPHFRVTHCCEQTHTACFSFTLTRFKCSIPATQQPPAAYLHFCPFPRLITPRQQPEQVRTPPGFLSCPELFAVFPCAGEER